MLNRPQMVQLYKTQDDLLNSHSHYVNESIQNLKSSEQIKQLLQPRQYSSNNNQTETDEFTDSLNQNSKIKKNKNQENQLLQTIYGLKQKLQKQQQDFYHKELTMQEQLLQSQLEHDKILRLTKSKYEMIIDDLKNQIKIKDEELYELQLQAKISRQKSSDKTLINKHSKRSSLITGEELDSDYAFTQRTQHAYTKSETTTLNDDKLLTLYRQEIDKLKHQTFEFAQKFETEKRSIKDEISLLKNQKVLLQTLLTNKSPISDRKPKSETKTSCKSQRKNSSIRMPQNKTKLKFD